METMKRLIAICIFVLIFAGISIAEVDTTFIVDESGSMSGEHTWIGDMVLSLEAGLVLKGETSNMYSLVGFGGSGGSHPVNGHKHSVGGSDWGDAGQLSAATSGLVVSGGTEDGWQAINFALNNYSFRSSALQNLILITDEERDNTDSSLTYENMLAALNAQNALLNVVVNCGFQDGSGNPALGIDSDGNAYIADGSGGYTVSPGGSVSSSYATTDTDYVYLALATGGAAWDLNQLRVGGLIAQSFTKAFVDIKVEEIINTISVVLDIKPSSWPNPLNVKSNGVLPVAIAGTYDFDVLQVNPETLKLEGVELLRFDYEDVCTYDDQSKGPDGLLDLTIKFDKQAIVAAIGPVVDGQEVVLTLTGNLYEDYGGTEIEGIDVVIILKKGK